MCKHDQVLGDPRSGGICLYCNEHLGAKQMLGYRQYTLDGNSNNGVYSRADYGIQHVNEIKS